MSEKGGMNSKQQKSNQGQPYHKLMYDGNSVTEIQRWTRANLKGDLCLVVIPERRDKKGCRVAKPAKICRLNLLQVYVACHWCRHAHSCELSVHACVCRLTHSKQLCSHLSAGAHARPLTCCHVWGRRMHGPAHASRQLHKRRRGRTHIVTCAMTHTHTVGANAAAPSHPMR